MLISAPPAKFNQMNFRHPRLALSQSWSVMFKYGEIITKYGMAAKAATIPWGPAFMMDIPAKK
jgi:hypothetical protein